MLAEGGWCGGLRQVTGGFRGGILGHRKDGGGWAEGRPVADCAWDRGETIGPDPSSPTGCGCCASRCK